MFKKYFIKIFFVFCLLSFVFSSKIFAARCSETKPCLSSTEYCSVNTASCVPKIGANQLCGKNEMCSSGKCENGLCAAEIITTTTPKDCPEGQYGLVSAGAYSCHSKLDIGTTCTTEEEYSFYGKYNNNSMCKSDYCQKPEYKCAANPNCEKNNYKLSTGFPGLGGAGACINPDTAVGSLIEKTLTFLFASIGTIAVIVFIYSGFLRAFSAGNSTMIKKSNEMIKNAITGLIMTLLSGTALAIINPDLIDIGIFKKAITPASVQIQVDESQKYIDKILNVTANCVNPIKKPYIQNQEPYKSTIYTGINEAPCKDTIGDSGCGPTSAAMVLNMYGISDYNDPKKTSTYSSKNSFHQCGSGTSIDFFSSIATAAKLKYLKVSTTDAIKYLEEGKPLVAYVISNIRKPSCMEYFTSSGHYLVVSCYDKINKSVKIDDPYIWKAGKRTSASYDNLVSCLGDSGFYMFYKE